MEAKHLPILALSVCVGPRAIHSVVIVLILGPLSTAPAAGKAKYRNPDGLDEISEQARPRINSGDKLNIARSLSDLAFDLV